MNLFSVSLTMHGETWINGGLHSLNAFWFSLDVWITQHLYKVFVITLLQTMIDMRA